MIVIDHSFRERTGLILATHGGGARCRPIHPRRRTVAVFVLVVAGLCTLVPATGSGRWTLRNATLTGVRQLAVDSSDPDRVFALISREGALGHVPSIFESSDGGRHWREAGFQGPEAATAAWAALTGTATTTPAVLPFGPDRGIGAPLAFDPEEPQIVYAAAREGIWKSRDRGLRWRRLEDSPSDQQVLLVDPSAPDTLWSAGLGVWRSRDGGITWSPVSTGLPGAPVTALALGPGDPPRLYAATADAGVFAFPGPVWLYSAGDPFGRLNAFDGIAISNPTDQNARIRLELIEANSSATAGETVVRDLPAGRQLARLRTDLFTGASDTPAWLELNSDTFVTSFFQFGLGDLSQLDGGVAVLEPALNFVFPRVYQGPGVFRGEDAGTRLSLFNPNPAPVRFRLTYHPREDDPPPADNPVERTLGPREALDESARDLFGDVLRGGYVTGEVIEGDGVAAFELVQILSRDAVLGFNALTRFAATRSYSAQYASAPELFSELNLINTATAAREVRLVILAPSGIPIGEPQTVQIAPGRQTFIDAATLFAPADPGAGFTFEGTLRVVADGEGVVGDVVFGSDPGLEFAAALPLQSALFSEAVFSQVANASGFFTGMAFHYPPPEGSAPSADDPQAEVELEVVLADGRRVGGTVLTLLPGERGTGLVDFLVPASAGQAGGFVLIRSSQPIIAQMLFGARHGEEVLLLSAVQPAVIR